MALPNIPIPDTASTFYIEELEAFIANNVDPSYFDEEDDDFKFWATIHKKTYPENYDDIEENK